MPAPAPQMGEWSRRLVEMAPRLTAARRERVLVLLHLDRWQEARAEAERWVRDEPNNATAIRMAERLSNRTPWPRSER